MSKKNKKEVLLPLTTQQEILLDNLQNSKYLRLDTQEDIENFYVLVSHKLAYTDYTESKVFPDKVCRISAVVAKSVYAPKSVPEIKPFRYPVGTKVKTKRHRHGYEEIYGVICYFDNSGYGIRDKDNNIYECKHKDLIILE
jgi:hypothetical protein